MPEEFENRVLTLKTHQMFFVHTTPEEFEKFNAAILVVLDVCLQRTRAGRSHYYRDAIVLEKLRYQMFLFHSKFRVRRSGMIWFRSVQ